MFKTFNFLFNNWNVPSFQAGSLFFSEFRFSIGVQNKIFGPVGNELGLIIPCLPIGKHPGWQIPVFIAVTIRAMQDRYAPAFSKTCNLWNDINKPCSKNDLACREHSFLFCLHFKMPVF